MVVKKKIVKKQSLEEPDKFQVFSGKLIFFARENTKKIIFIALGIFAIAVAISLYAYLSNKAEDKLANLTQTYQEKYQTELENSNPQEAFQKVQSDFESMLDKYAGTEGINLSRKTYADICYDAGQTDRAVELYQKILNSFDKNPELKNTIALSLGYAYMQNKEPESARKYFEQIVAGNEDYLKAEAYYNLGLIYEKSGETDKSKQAYEKIVSDYPGYVYYDLLKGKVTPKEEKPKQSEKTSG